MVDFTAKTLHIVTNQFTVVPTAHTDTLSDTYSNEDTLASTKTLINRTMDYLYSNDTVSISFERIISLIDTELLADALYELQTDTLTDTILNYDLPVYTIENIATLIDTITSSVTTSNQLVGISHLAVIAAFKDILENALFDNLSDASSYYDVLTSVYEHTLRAIDTALFGDVISGSKYINVYLTDTNLSEDVLSNTAELFQYIIDSTEWLATLGIDGSDYLTYVLNTQSNGVTQYDNFAFNSMSENLAAASDGIYKLSGDSDSGAFINAHITSGLMDFGENAQKQVPYAYVGITSDNDVVLKTITTHKGIKKERWYKINTANDSFDTSRVKLGKGVKSRYWQFTLENIDGSDFNLESLDITPLILKRRI